MTWIHKGRDIFIKHATGRYGVMWLGLFSALESIFLPTPTDTMMMALLLLKDNRQRWFYISTITMITSVIGAVIGYFIAFFAYDLLATWLSHSSYMQHGFDGVHKFLSNGTFIFTFIGAISPIPYKFFVLTAGFVKANFLVFLIASIIGRSFRLYPSGWLVYKYGDVGVKIVRRYAVHITLVSIVAIVLYIFAHLYLS